MVLIPSFLQEHSIKQAVVCQALFLKSEDYRNTEPCDNVDIPLVTNHLCKFRVSSYGDKIIRILSVHRIPPFVTDRLFFDAYILSQVKTFFKRADFCGSPMRNKP